MQDFGLANALRHVSHRGELAHPLRTHDGQCTTQHRFGSLGHACGAPVLQVGQKSLRQPSTRRPPAIGDHISPAGLDSLGEIGVLGGRGCVCVVPNHKLNTGFSSWVYRITDGNHCRPQVQLRLIAGIEGNAKTTAVDGVGGKGLVDSLIDHPHGGFVTSRDSAGFHNAIAGVLIRKAGLAKGSPQERHYGLSTQYIIHASCGLVLPQPRRQVLGIASQCPLDVVAVQVLHRVTGTDRCTGFCVIDES
ncbi:hypothetical protein D3C81_1460890 [compost metagenome]